MPAIRIIFLAFLIPFQTHACMQTGGTTIHGGRATVSPYELLLLQLRQSIDESPEMHLDRLIRGGRLKPADDLSEKEIQGVEEVLMGDYDLAISIFTEIEADIPGRYATAANLGTVYELKGELEPALQWISEGIRRNPESHLGTEWLHVEIIRARMKLKEDTGYLRKHHVIELPRSLSKESKIEISGNLFSPLQVANALQYQLKERMIFVKPADPVVADLLFIYSEIRARTSSVESALGLLQLAGEYGFQDSAILAGKIKHYQWLIRFRLIWQTALIVLAITAAVLFLVYAYRRKWFFLTTSEYRRHQREMHPTSVAKSWVG